MTTLKQGNQYRRFAIKGELSLFATQSKGQGNN